MGSTSLQIAFEPHSSNKSIQANYSEEVTVNGQKFNIYAHSYMCMGRDEFGRRYYAKLAVVSIVSLPYIFLHWYFKFWFLSTFSTNLPTPESQIKRREGKLRIVCAFVIIDLHIWLLHSNEPYLYIYQRY